MQHERKPTGKGLLGQVGAKPSGSAFGPVGGKTGVLACKVRRPCCRICSAIERLRMVWWRLRNRVPADQQRVTSGFE